MLLTCRLPLLQRPFIRWTWICFPPPLVLEVNLWGKWYILQAGCPFCHPTHSVETRSTEWNTKHWPNQWSRLHRRIPYEWGVAAFMPALQHHQDQYDISTMTIHKQDTLLLQRKRHAPESRFGSEFDRVLVGVQAKIRARIRVWAGVQVLIRVHGPSADKVGKQIIIWQHSLSATFWPKIVKIRCQSYSVLNQCDFLRHSKLPTC